MANAVSSRSQPLKVAGQGANVRPHGFLVLVDYGVENLCQVGKVEIVEDFDVGRISALFRVVAPSTNGVLPDVQREDGRPA